ncbi:hypothetical protein DL766_006868 [Monosporascus sp. MC13-8B]|uniref:Uncharacterized protein n=1 Tax=Monosporascus cannonballus TaxID=155416 RepID=A0ABY0H0S9_9PEZI|nr:hypothetical protein DL762_008172 [Monosporascus cannonballus]RYO82693.1 hypothetical protein DL763_008148 [Monosporascus cannonballus]RYP25986.1 hypothetical protein DL766_006868 [Monosporascus sp. MC13-8B]
MSRREDPASSDRTSASRDSRRSAESCDSRSTAPTSFYGSPRPSTKGSSSEVLRFQPSCHDEDLSPSTSLYPRSSVDTYSSQASSADLESIDTEDDVGAEIPPLPVYCHEIEEANVRASTPEDFAALFPSMNRLTIRHDDFTSDGNMNLRVDTVVSGRRRKIIQLFHLRMYDLNKRDFSLRRYCRDSGREVCSSKRKYIEPTAAAARPILQRSVSSAMKSLTGRPQLKRAPTGGSTLSNRSRPGTGNSVAEADDEFADAFGQAFSLDKPKPRPVSTNTLKLEFSNYARVDIQRRGNRTTKRYEFEWWGHKYSWKRVVDKLTGVVSFHLLRDGNNHSPVAHIVPETRSPTQVAIDEQAGGWVPPCHMWISDKDIIDAMTDVADVVVATGLMALVDDCIRERWQPKKPRRLSLPLTPKTMDPRAFVQHIFSRRASETHATSPLRYHTPIAAY